MRMPTAVRVLVDPRPPHARDFPMVWANFLCPYCDSKWVLYRSCEYGGGPAYCFGCSSFLRATEDFLPIVAWNEPVDWVAWRREHWPWWEEISDEEEDYDYSHQQ